MHYNAMEISSHDNVIRFKRFPWLISDSDVNCEPVSDLADDAWVHTWIFQPKHRSTWLNLPVNYGASHISFKATYFSADSDPYVQNFDSTSMKIWLKGTPEEGDNLTTLQVNQCLEKKIN